MIRRYAGAVLGVVAGVVGSVVLCFGSTVLVAEFASSPVAVVLFLVALVLSMVLLWEGAFRVSLWVDERLRRVVVEVSDTYAYRSFTTGELITWTRDSGGVWTADDGRDMTATDADIEAARCAEAGQEPRRG